MFAVIKTGGKQYKVAKADVIEVEKLDNEDGSTVNFDVLMVSDGKTAGTGSSAGTVEGKVVSATKGPKVIIMKHRRRKNSRRKTGHRQKLTLVEITSIKKG